MEKLWRGSVRVRWYSNASCKKSHPYKQKHNPVKMRKVDPDMIPNTILLQVKKFKIYCELVIFVLLESHNSFDVRWLHSTRAGFLRGWKWSGSRTKIMGSAYIIGYILRWTTRPYQSAACSRWPVQMRVSKLTSPGLNYSSKFICKYICRY